MKKTALFSVFAFIIISFMCSCEKSCSGKGTLSFENGSLGTVQRIMVDGTNHGSIDPGEKKEVDLAAGEHDYQFLGISGGGGCSPASIIIIECETEYRKCNF